MCVCVCVCVCVNQGGYVEGANPGSDGDAVVKEGMGVVGDMGNWSFVTMKLKPPLGGTMGSERRFFSVLVELVARVRVADVELAGARDGSVASLESAAASAGLVVTVVAVVAATAVACEVEVLAALAVFAPVPACVADPASCVLVRVFESPCEVLRCAAGLSTGMVSQNSAWLLAPWYVVSVDAPALPP